MSIKILEGSDVCNCKMDLQFFENFRRLYQESYYYTFQNFGTMNQKKICGSCGKELTKDKYYRVKKYEKFLTAKGIVEMYYNPQNYIPYEKFIQARSALIDLEKDLKNV